MKIIINLKKIYYKFFSKINNDIIYISSFDGKYSDSPRYISEEIHKIDPSKQIYWLINDFHNEDIPDYVIKIKKNSNDDLKLQYTAKILIDNVYANKSSSLNSDKLLDKIKYRLNRWIKYKKNQKIYTTWHGTPLKRMGIDQIGSTVKKWDCPNTTMILGNKHSIDIMDRLTFHKLKMKLIGIPRNDILFKNVNTKKLKSKLDLPVNKKILLFAPSFRSDADSKLINIDRSGINQLKSIDFKYFNKVLHEKFGGDWVFVCRFHYHVEKNVDWDSIKEEYGDMVINGNKYEDIAEYLRCTDILLTDISSCFFDFLLTAKPIFSFFPDFDYYATKERGLYINSEELPFTISKTFKELIDSVDNFDNDKYLSLVESFNKKLDYVGLEPDISKKVAKFILEDSKNV